MQPKSQLSRRQFMTAATGALAAGLSHVSIRTPLWETTDIPAIPATRPFFQQHIGEIPSIAPEHWSLWVYGVTRIPQIVTHSDMLARNSVTLSCTLLCAGNSSGSDLTGHAEWRGIRIYEMLNLVDLPKSVGYLRFDCADGYSTCLDLQRLQDGIFAYEMNGQPLAPQYGFPLRLVAPGLYGYKLPKWIQRISLTSEPHIGFWESLGWPQEGIVRTA